MWPFARVPSKAILQDYKTVSISGSKFVIRKINPLADFTVNNMPQIFSSFNSRRRPEDQSISKQQRALADMKVVVEAGLVDPELVPVSKSKEGITVDDIFRDMDTGISLYWEIIIHALNKFKGLKGIFFSARIRYELRMLSQKDMGDSQVKSSSETVSA